ncbi:HTH-type transcriptional regulator TfdS [Lactobacillus helveticus]|nr:HTH-type transcriptional regulator TfdS [Lactobacillus helveticus]
MNIKQLRYFLVVAEEKQITSAAKRLYIAQPPLSYQLKQLEIELGAQLFKRTAHGIELTDAGQILQSYASEILSLSESVKN